MPRRVFFANADGPKFRILVFLHVLDVAAGTECAACAGQDHCTHAHVGRELFAGGDELRHGGVARQRIARSGWFMVSVTMAPSILRKSVILM